MPVLTITPRRRHLPLWTRLAPAELAQCRPIIDQLADEITEKLQKPYAKPAIVTCCLQTTGRVIVHCRGRMPVRVTRASEGYYWDVAGMDYLPLQVSLDWLAAPTAQDAVKALARWGLERDKSAAYACKMSGAQSHAPALSPEIRKTPRVRYKAPSVYDFTKPLAQYAKERLAADRSIDLG